jgi:hypothetical protein
MTLSQSDLKLALHGGLDRKIVKSIFSNILISSVVLLILILFIFKVNKDNYFSTFVYGYMAVVAYSLVSAKYIKDDFCSKKTNGINKDFESLMSNATANPVIIQSKSGMGEYANPYIVNKREERLDELAELDSFLSNSNEF